MRVWVTSDHHFGHANIIEHESRPFKTTSQMEVELVNRWNRIVEASDLVYYLGDFAWRTKVGERVLPQLKGHKMLIRGNHDPESLMRYVSMGFRGVADMVGLNVLGARLQLVHVPPRNIPEPFDYCIHGHIHSHAPSDIANIIEPHRYYNVSVERTDYAPISLERVVEILRRQCHKTH